MLRLTMNEVDILLFKRLLILISVALLLCSQTSECGVSNVFFQVLNILRLLKNLLARRCTCAPQRPYWETHPARMQGHAHPGAAGKSTRKTTDGLRAPQPFSHSCPRPMKPKLQLEGSVLPDTRFLSCLSAFAK